MRDDVERLLLGARSKESELIAAMNILVVEENEQMRRAIRSLVSDIADQLHECSDRSRAITAYAESRPDWTFVDIRIGNVDELTVVSQIKSAYPKARIVVMTNYDDDDFREAARLAGASDYVCKENLIEVRRILSAA